jgi:DnaJ-domain-containing protein 1
MNNSEIGAILFMGVIGYVVVAGIIRWREELSARKKWDQKSSSSKQQDSASQTQEQTDMLWHEVLDVDPAASTETIKASYRTLIRRYHPDKVHSLGEEFREIAERRAKEINQAYATAQKVKGFN